MGKGGKKGITPSMLKGEGEGREGGKGSVPSLLQRGEKGR